LVVVKAAVVYVVEFALLPPTTEAHASVTPLSSDSCHWILAPLECPKTVREVVLLEHITLDEGVTDPPLGFVDPKTILNFEPL
jgi:hypothetical protein